MLNEQPPVPPDSPHGIPSFAAAYRINPLLALTMFIVDQMLGVLELGSLEALAFLSFVVGLLLIVPCTLVQRYADRDPWGLAIAKGTLCGIIVSIPTSIGSTTLAAWGLASAGRGKATAAKDTIDTDGVEVK
jgi:hypothetical protein